MSRRSTTAASPSSSSSSSGPRSLLVHRRHSSDNLLLPLSSSSSSAERPLLRRDPVSPSAPQRVRISRRRSRYEVGTSLMMDGTTPAATTTANANAASPTTTTSISSSSTSPSTLEDSLSSHSKPSSSSSAAVLVFSSSLRWAATLLVVVALSTMAASLVVSQLLTEHDTAVRDRVRRLEFDPLTNHLEGQLEDLEHDKTALQNRLSQLETDRQQMRQQAYAVALLPHLQDQLHQLQSHVDTYHTRLQKMSRARILEAFGAGPHFVEVTVAFATPPNKLSMTSKPMFTTAHQQPLYRIVLRLAPYTDMPHSVHWFLEQVSRGLYDGTSFHSRADHVVQAGPVANFMFQNDASSASASSPQLYRRFRDAGFEHVLFQEYHPKWPHLKYTVGYAGRPGGPDFYFNMRDNSDIHGPGGQNGQTTTLLEDGSGREADPCFAIVVEGFDVVDQLHALPAVAPEQVRLQQPPAIISMRIMESDEVATTTRR